MNRRIAGMIVLDRGEKTTGLSAALKFSMPPGMGIKNGSFSRSNEKR
jgi:hypothetical protein